MSTSFYSAEELKTFGFHRFGKNVLISKKASFYKPEVISFGDNVRIDDFCLISGGNEIEFGCYIHISCYTVLYGNSGIIIKDFCNLAAHVTIYSECDDISGNSMINPMIPMCYKPGYQKGKVILEKHSAVGVSSTIFPGVILGEGAIVGAHSFVTKNCEPWTIYVGAPAKKLKTRNKKLLDYEKEFLKRDNLPK